jgi:hypothetical protein
VLTPIPNRDELVHSEVLKLVGYEAGWNGKGEAHQHLSDLGNAKRLILQRVKLYHSKRWLTTRRRCSSSNRSAPTRVAYESPARLTTSSRSRKVGLSSIATTSRHSVRITMRSSLVTSLLLQGEGLTMPHEAVGPSDQQTARAEERRLFDSSGVGVSVLLREACGFEGLRPTVVHSPLHPLSGGEPSRGVLLRHRPRSIPPTGGRWKRRGCNRDHRLITDGTRTTFSENGT